jgi:hypothetical protein
LELPPGFLAYSPAGNPSFLIPIGPLAQVTGRVFGHLSLDFKERFLFETADCRWEEPAAVFECTDERWLRAFCGLCLDLARRIGMPQPRPTAQNVLEALRESETLLSVAPS